MDVRIEPRLLQAELSLALGIIESKATIPILSNILLRATENQVELAATDTEVTIRTSCPAEVLVGGGVTVPAKKFGAIVRAFANQESPLSLKTTEEGKLFLQPVGGEQEYLLQTLPEEDYPVLLQPEPDRTFTLPIELFKDCITDILVSIGGDDARFSIRGGMLILEAGKIVMVSTDSHRLSYTEQDCLTGVEEPQRVIVPRKTFVEFLKLGEENGTFDLYLKDKHIFLKSGRRLLYSRLMDSTFPAFEKILTGDLGNRAIIDRKVFLERVKRVAMVAESTTRAATFSFEPGTAGLEIQVINQETGDKGRESVPCESYEGEAITMVFNVDCLIDFLTVCSEELVKIEMKDAKYHALLEPVRPEGKGVHKYVIMPLRFD